MEKHRHISNELKLEIASGHYDATGRLPSEAQLVTRFKVSRPTVARALLDLQKAGLIERRAGAGSFLNPPSSNETSELIGLLVPDRGATEIFDQICGEIGLLARLQRFGVLWGRSPHPLQDRLLDADGADEACRHFIQREVRGIVFAPFEHRSDSANCNRSLLDLLRQAGIPVILIDRDITPFPLRSDYDLIGLDNVQAGFLAADHLLRLGCQSLRLFSKPQAAGTIDAREAGIREAVVRRGFSVSKSIRIEGDPTDAKFVRSLFRRNSPDAIVCGNDDTAVHLLNTLKQTGVRVPDDVRIVGIDDVRQASLSDVPLTTIRQPCRDIAMHSFRALQDRIRDASIPPRTILLAPTLVVRDSCGAYPQNQP